MPFLLELFSGTGSVGQVAQGLGWNVASLDKDMPASIQTDILDWDYKILPPKTFDFIWASPPCTEYSCAKTTGKRNLELADSIAQRTLEIIDYFKPSLGFCVENPQTGLLKGRSFMENRPYTDIDYCKYGMPYRKRTRLWNSIQDRWQARPLCKRDCGNIREGTKRHLQVAQRVPKTKDDAEWQQKWRQTELYRVPHELVHDILTAVRPQSPLEVVPIFVI